MTGRGNGSDGRRRRFSLNELRYLRGLPAVARVTEDRIYYTDRFREDATARYLQGESPTQIFREAGLDPKLIGHKRVERAFARWREQAPTGRDRVMSDTDTTQTYAKTKPSAGHTDQDDPRDRLIVNQALRIAELEKRIDLLERQYGTGQHADDQDIEI